MAAASFAMHRLKSMRSLSERLGRAHLIRQRLGSEAAFDGHGQADTTISTGWIGTLLFLRMTERRAKRITWRHAALRVAAVEIIGVRSPDRHAVAESGSLAKTGLVRLCLAMGMVYHAAHNLPKAVYLRAYPIGEPCRI